MMLARVTLGVSSTRVRGTVCDQEPRRLGPRERAVRPGVGLSSSDSSGRNVQRWRFRFLFKSGPSIAEK